MPESDLLIVIGTRPDAIKLAPLIAELRRRGRDVRVLSTGQHRELLEPLVGLLGLDVDAQLDVMRDNQSLPDLHRAIVDGVSRHLDVNPASRVIVQGDTTTAFAAALAAFYARTPVAHVEAGLRTRKLDGPWPEELHRQAIARIADLHFAPTDRAARNLRDESVSGEIHVVGNTIVDALNSIGDTAPASGLPVDPPYVVVTCHRREQGADGFVGFVSALRQVARAHTDLQFLYPVHPNPVVRGAVEAGLASVDNVVAVPAMPYDLFVTALRGARAVLTDSGGVQEEATALGIPVLVMRETSDRPEAIEAGSAVLVGIDHDEISAALADLPSVEPSHLYGDGEAARRIAELL